MNDMPDNLHLKKKKIKQVNNKQMNTLNRTKHEQQQTFTDSHQYSTHNQSN
jgi:hypothetical protein